MQTQCPQCHTAFRVSEEQLKLADGKVRCGQCLHVFIASEHFIDEASMDSDVPVTEDEFSISHIELEASEVELPGELSTDELVHNDLELAEIEIADIEMPVLDALDEHVAEPIKTETDSSELLAEPSTDPALETPSETSASENSAKPSLVVQVPLIQDTDETVDENWLEEEREAELAAAEAISAIAEQADREQEEALEEAADIPETSPPSDAIPLLVESFDASQLYPEFSAAPVAPKPQYTGLYSLAIIVLLGVFLLQGTYALRDTLAVQPALRPFMSSFCATFHCALALPREPGKILLTHSEVRSHPAKRGALLVKASMKNQARFRQAYPLLRLQFSDLEGQPLVGRDFLPEEYLPDDVNINAGMPINTNVNLSLELVDPGGEAVSFDFNLL